MEPWDLTQPPSALGGKVPNNTSHHLLVRCKESLGLFNNIPLQTAHVSHGDISGSVHRVSEQPHKCRNDTGGPDTNSREQQLRDKVIEPVPGADASLHVASGAAQSQWFSEAPSAKCLTIRPPVSSSRRKARHSQFPTKIF